MKKITYLKIGLATLFFFILAACSQLPDTPGATNAPISQDPTTNIIIGDIDTGIPNASFEGSTIQDLLNDCAEHAENHGDYVSCIAHLTNRLVKAKVITGAQKGVIQRAAAQADIP